MSNRKRFAALLAAPLLFAAGRPTFAQPLVRPGENDDEAAESTPEEDRRRELAREKARLEEEQRMRVQADLLRMQGEQMQAQREEKDRNDRMMRYALVVAIAVIATTFLIAFARSRVADKDEMSEAN